MTTVLNDISKAYIYNTNQIAQKNLGYNTDYGNGEICCLLKHCTKWALIVSCFNYLDLFYGLEQLQMQWQRAHNHHHLSVSENVQPLLFVGATLK